MSYFSIIKKIFYFVIYEKKYSKNQKIEHFFYLILSKFHFNIFFIDLIIKVQKIKKHI